MRIFLLLYFVLFNKLNATILSNGDQGLGSRNDTEFRVMTISPVWLKELEDTYKSGFPKNFGFTKHRNISTVPNHNVPSGDGSTCQNVTFFSVEQNRRLVNRYGWDSVWNSTTKEMINNPRARLFRYKYHGEMEDYRFLRSEREGMCTNLKNLRRRVESVFTFGKCIRLFERHHCQGWSLAVYPGSGNSEELIRPRDVTFQAIGPCLSNEFAGGGFNESFPTFIFKNPEFRSFNPDLTVMTPVYIRSRVKIYDQLLYMFSLGPENRIEIIGAWLGQRVHIVHQAVNGENVSFLNSSEDNDDIVGYAIPPKFGGTTNGTFNRFPASQSCLSDWENVLSGFVGNHTLYVHLKFEYENEIETRPLFFYYAIKLKVNISDDEYLAKWYYGRIINALHGKSKRDVPYIQDNERRKVTKKNLHYIHMNFSPVFQSLESLTVSNFDATNINNSAGNRNPDLLNCQQIISNDVESNEHKGLGESPMKKNGHYVGPTGWDNSEDPQIIMELFFNPMVRLFSGNNFSGKFEDYHSGIAFNYSVCYDTRQVRHVKSAEAFNKCIRLFANTECRGLSLAIYPRRANSDVPLDTILTEVLSVGPCIPADFKKNKKSSSSFPDIFTFSDTPRPNSKLYSTNNLDVLYSLGPKNRTEQIHASIYQPGLPDLTERINLEETDFYESEFYGTRDKNTGDVPGFAIPTEIGGPQNMMFNIFLMDESQLDTWADIFPSFYSDQNEIFNWNISFKFVYDTDLKTRPKYIYYYFKDEQTKEIYYGQFTNL